MTDFEKEGKKLLDTIAEELKSIRELDAMYEYLQDVYDIEYRVDCHKRYRSVRLTVACGGPNIYVDTQSCKVVLYWGQIEAYAPLTLDAIELIDHACEEMWGECW